MKSLFEIVEKLTCEYDYVGIRIQEEPFCLGPICHDSSVWEDGEKTDTKLDGICAVRVDADNAETRYADSSRYYYGDHAAILVSYRAEYGDDANEIIMKDAEVAHIIR